MGSAKKRPKEKEKPEKAAAAGPVAEATEEEKDERTFLQKAAPRFLRIFTTMVVMMLFRYFQYGK